MSVALFLGTLSHGQCLYSTGNDISLVMKREVQEVT
jgi:hypothetical protein